MKTPPAGGVFQLGESFSFASTRTLSVMSSRVVRREKALSSACEQDRGPRQSRFWIAGVVVPEESALLQFRFGNRDRQSL